MTIDIETARKISGLARLKIPEDQLPRVVKDLNGILAWVGQLDELDVTDIEPLANCNDEFLRCREDIVTDGNQPEAILANAPSKTADFFTVPKVVE